jgi:hypothetical protein
MKVRNNKHRSKPKHSIFTAYSYALAASARFASLAKRLPATIRAKKKSLAA